MNIKVLSVEPSISNINRIHKAVRSDAISTKNILLFHNAVYNTSDQVKLLSESKFYNDEESLIDNINKTFELVEDPNNRYLVKTIVMDDLVDYLPKREDGGEFKRAVMKMTLNGMEPYAFQRASKLFAKINVSSIYMYWKFPFDDSTTKSLVKSEIVDNLAKRGYKPFFYEIKLDIDSWQQWPYHVMWMK